MGAMGATLRFDSLLPRMGVTWVPQFGVAAMWTTNEAAVRMTRERNDDSPQSRQTRWVRFCRIRREGEVRRQK